MEKEPISELILDVRQHPAVRDLVSRDSRSTQDINQLEALKQEHLRKLVTLRRDLSQLRLDREMGRPSDPKLEASLIRQVGEAESDLDVVVEEIKRRRQIKTGYGDEMAEAVKIAGAEATEILGPVVRGLTQQFLDGLALANHAATELHGIYYKLQRADAQLYGKHGIRQPIIAPHASPVFSIGPFSIDEYLKRVQDQIRAIQVMGYTITEMDQTNA